MHLFTDVAALSEAFWRVNWRRVLEQLNEETSWAISTGAQPCRFHYSPTQGTCSLSFKPANKWEHQMFELEVTRNSRHPKRTNRISIKPFLLILLSKSNPASKHFLQIYHLSGKAIRWAYHSDTQSSQKMCLQRSDIGACIFSWQIAHISPAARTWAHQQT